MPRPDPGPPHVNVPAVSTRSSRLLTEARLKVVTPMFGGGPSAGHVDPIHPVRGGTVRGHLRFWWRALNAHACADAADLFAAEAEFWGRAAAGTSTPAAIEVEVEITDIGQPEPREDPILEDPWTKDQNGYPSYALFPFQRLSNQKPPRDPLRARTGVTFTVRLLRAPHCDRAKETKLKKAAEAALRAWIAFGGVGARTRRGCGALWSETPAYQLPRPAQGQTATQAALTWLQSVARLDPPLTPKAGHPPVPVLHGARLLLSLQTRDINEAWRRSVNEMQTFRQGKDIGRRSGSDPNRPMKLGRSYWPEADSIRRANPDPKRRHKPEHEAGRYFPRAEFGLPIIFHFIDGDDPPDQTLAPASPGAGRMASPFILKPLPIAHDKALAIVLLLNAPRLTDLRVPVRITPGGTTPAVAQPAEILDPTKAAAVRPLSATGEADPREAFLNFVAGRPGWNTGVVTL